MPGEHFLRRASLPDAPAACALFGQGLETSERSFVNGRVRGLVWAGAGSAAITN